MRKPLPLREIAHRQPMRRAGACADSPMHRGTDGGHNHHMARGLLYYAADERCVMPLEVVDVCDDDGVSGANLREKVAKATFSYCILDFQPRFPSKP
jgi:hypothetical protein